MSDMRLMHIADSALPTGGYVYSYGLESAAKHGLLPSFEAFRAYLDSYRWQVYDSELPFVRACFSAPPPIPGPGLLGIVTDYEAMTWLPITRRASTTSARTWLQLFLRLYPDANIPSLRQWFCEQQAVLHFTIAFAVSMRLAGYEWGRAHALLCYIAMRDQISAAIRLGLLGPADAHSLLHEICATKLPEPSESYSQAVKSCPVLEIAQATHKNIYAKLFRN